MSVRRYYVERRRRKRRNGYTHNHLVAGLLSTMFFIAILLGFVAFMARM